MDTALQIGTPEQRETALRAIEPSRAHEYHPILRKIFAAEIEYRCQDGELDYFENLYWCAWLLFHVGDPNDIEMMWKAKHINMDTGSGFDAENMVGAGIRESVDYLRARKLDPIADYLDESLSNTSPTELESWSNYKNQYFRRGL
jgi:hypothetical protein